MTFGVEKLEWRGYPVVKKFEDMSSRFDRILACDRRTDKRTDVLRRHSRAMRKHRAIKIHCRVWRWKNFQIRLIWRRCWFTIYTVFRKKSYASNAKQTKVDVFFWTQCICCNLAACLMC